MIVEIAYKNEEEQNSELIRKLSEILDDPILLKEKKDEKIRNLLKEQ